MRGPRIAMKSGPHSPQLEKTLTQKRRPNTAKNKINKIIIKKIIIIMTSYSRGKHRTQRSRYKKIPSPVLKGEVGGDSSTSGATVVEARRTSRRW